MGAKESKGNSDIKVNKNAAKQAALDQKSIEAFEKSKA